MKFSFGSIILLLATCVAALPLTEPDHTVTIQTGIEISKAPDNSNTTLHELNARYVYIHGCSWKLVVKGQTFIEYRPVGYGLVTWSVGVVGGNGLYCSITFDRGHDGLCAWVHKAGPSGPGCKPGFGTLAMGSMGA